MLRTIRQQDVAADGSRRILPAPRLAPTAVGGYMLLANRARYELSGLGGGSWSARRLVGQNRVNAMVVADSVNLDLHLIPDLVAKQ